MNKIFEAIAAHAYLNSPEYEKSERERLLKADKEFVNKYIIDVVGTAAERAALNFKEYENFH